MAHEAGYLELDVAALPVDQQFAAWAATLYPYKPFPVAGAVGFRAVARAWLLPPIIVSESALGAFSTQRSGEDAARDREDGVTVQLFLEGGMHGTTPRGSFAAVAGDIALQDASQPFSAEVRASRVVAVTMPRAAIEERIEIAPHHGRVLSGSLAPLLAAVMRQLPDALAGHDGQGGDIAAIVCSTLAAVLREMPLGDAGTIRDDRALRFRVRRFIGRNLAGDLSITALCGAMGASRSALTGRSATTAGWPATSRRGGWRS